MRKIKNYKDFINEDLDPQLWSMYWESHLLGTLGYLASFGLSYLLFRYFRGQSEEKSIENAKEKSDNIRRSDEMKDVLKKVIKNENVKELLNKYKDKIENKTITFNEMKTLGEEMKNLLGDILTTDEWHLCEHIIDDLSKSPDKNLNQISKGFTEEEEELLDRYGFKKRTDNEYINQELGIRIFKKMNKEGSMVYEFNRENKEFTQGSIFAAMSKEPELISGYYKDLEKCIIGATTDDSLIDELHKMMKEQKTLFKRSRKKDIIDLLDSINNREEMFSIITDYREKYGKDLVELFDEMGNNFTENELLSPFYKLGLITKTNKYGSDQFDKNY
jgi:hypothetical protein